MKLQMIYALKKDSETEGEARPKKKKKHHKSDISDEERGAERKRRKKKKRLHSKSCSRSQSVVSTDFHVFCSTYHDKCLLYV